MNDPKGQNPAEPAAAGTRVPLPASTGQPTLATECLPGGSGTAGGEGELPDRFGRYRVVSLLGSGGFGAVYKGRDEELRREVAIKVPRPGLVASEKDVESYLAEARTLAGLDHPHIVPVYDVGRTADGLCFVVSKVIEGSDLARRIAEGRPPVAESVEITAAVAEALHYAHTRGLVHRDVKPANILLDRAGKPYLSDFGLALRDEDFGKGAGYAGTPAYMSPEQARGEGHRVDGRSDIFSLGAVLYELLTGHRPFRGESQAEVLKAITTAEARPPRQIDDSLPKELERICLKALAKPLTERYTTARDMADDLWHAQGPQNTTKLSKRGRRRARGVLFRGEISKAGCVLAVTLASVMLVTWSWKEVPAPPSGPPTLVRAHPTLLREHEELSLPVVVTSLVGHLAPSAPTGPISGVLTLELYSQTLALGLWHGSATNFSREPSSPDSAAPAKEAGKNTTSDGQDCQHPVGVVELVADSVESLFRAGGLGVVIPHGPTHNSQQLTLRHAAPFLDDLQGQSWSVSPQPPPGPAK
jgi:serine/threonine protein kinase